MYGGTIKCPECGYDFYCETIYSTIDCPSCGHIIGLQPIPEPVTEEEVVSNGAVVSN